MAKIQNKILIMACSNIHLKFLESNHMECDKLFNCDGAQNIEVPKVKATVERVTISPDCVTTFKMSNKTRKKK